MTRFCLLAFALLVSRGAHSLTLTNCNQSWQFERIPQRTVVYTHSAYENLAALQLTSSIISVVGYRKEQDGAPSPWTQSAETKIHFDNAPWSGEALLVSQPDFIYSGSFYWFNSPETPDCHQLDRWGIATWLSESVCYGLQSKTPTALTFEGIYTEIRNIAHIYHVQPRAEALIDSLRRSVTDDAKKAAALPARQLIWWYSGLSTPYVAGGYGAPELLTRTVGSENVFKDSEELWPAVSWEVIAARDPDFIVVGDLRRGGPGDSAADKIAFLESNPFTAGMRAVRQKHYIILPGYDMDPSVRTIPALSRLVSQLQSFKPQEK